MYGSLRQISPVFFRCHVLDEFITRLEFSRQINIEVPSIFLKRDKK